MTGLVVSMLKLFAPSVVEVLVFPDGHIDIGNRDSLSDAVIHDAAKDCVPPFERPFRGFDQLISIRHLELKGWALSPTRYWKEEKA